jgi:hypothetical protein
MRYPIGTSPFRQGRLAEASGGAPRVRAKSISEVLSLLRPGFPEEFAPAYGRGFGTSRGGRS